MKWYTRGVRLVVLAGGPNDPVPAGPGRDTDVRLRPGPAERAPANRPRSLGARVVRALQSCPRMTIRTLLLGTACVAAGCTGMSLGENTPGGDTWVDPTPTQPGEHRMGAIAVERDEDQLWVVHEENREGVVRAHLAAVDPDTGATVEVMDVTGANDRRVVFPAGDRMIFLAETGGRDNLVLFDTTTREPIRSVAAETWYWGTRTAPSGRALVVADNQDELLPLHVIDTSTLRHQVLEHGGDLVEAMWNHHEDVLLALSVSAPFGTTPVARLLRYDLRGADFTAPLPPPTVAWELAGYGWDYWFSYTWIGISPDDHWAVFPLMKRTAGESEHVLLILDQTTGEVELVPGRGPVGFTRDGQSIVSYGVRADGGQDLWLIDPVTLDRKVVTMPFTAGVSFLVSRDTDHIVCDPVFGSGAPLVVYDVASDEVHTIDAPAVDLWDYVTRRGTDELWLETGGDVRVLSLSEPSLERVSLDSALASHINIRPSVDQAVVADATRAAIRRIDMETRRAAGDVIALPSPFERAAASTLATPQARVAGTRVQSPFDPQYRAEAVPSPGVRLAR